MRKVILADKQQLKCNFCTQWFTVSTHFATIQRYSLNACQRCFANFKYQLVDSNTYEIYHVFLLNTGFKLTDNHQSINQAFEQLLSQSNPKVKEIMHHYDEIITNIQRSTQEKMRQMKENVGSLCENIIKKMIKNWEDSVTTINSLSKMVEKQKQRKINIMTKSYDFSKDPQKLLDSDANEESITKINEKKNKILKLDEQNIIKKITSPLFHNKDSNKESNKQNMVGTKTLKKNKSLKNIKTLRQTVMNKKQEKQTSTLRHNILSRSIKDQKETSCSRSNLSSRKYQLDCSFEQLNQKQPYLLDEYRNQVITNLKDKPKFQTYLPQPQPSKIPQINKKIWGQKTMIENIVQLKMKTNIDGNQCQIINENLSGINLSCLLKSLDWQSTVSIIKIVKTQLNDHCFDQFLHWLSDKPQIQTLVLTNNRLTETSVIGLQHFIERHGRRNLKNVYLGNNWIRNYKIKQQIQWLKSKNISIFA